MGELRIKGQEVTWSIIGPTGDEDSVDAIADGTVTFESETLSEGYLGESSERQDDIFRRVTFALTIHLPRADYFNLIRRIVDRQQRRTPATEVFNLVMANAFPNGERGRLLLPDIKFGEIPLEVGARDEYVSSTINGATDEFTFL